MATAWWVVPLILALVTLVIVVIIVVAVLVTQNTSNTSALQSEPPETAGGPFPADRSIVNIINDFGNRILVAPIGSNVLSIEPITATPNTQRANSRNKFEMRFFSDPSNPTTRVYAINVLKQPDGAQPSEKSLSVPVVDNPADNPPFVGFANNDWGNLTNQRWFLTLLQSTSTSPNWLGAPQFALITGANFNTTFVMEYSTPTGNLFIRPGNWSTNTGQIWTIVPAPAT